MPFTYDPNLDDDQKEKDASQVQISGAAPTADTGGTTANKSGPAASQNTGSGFQNLDKYLQTNQAQQFGDQVVGKVQDQVTQAKGNIDSASTQFGQKVQSANSLPNQEQVNSAIANPSTADAKQFQGWESQQYTGPQSLAEDQDDYNKFWSGTNQANTQAQLLGTEPGRFTLLDSYFGRPNYGFGQKSLDNLLIQQGGIGDKTKDLQDQAAQLKTYGNDQTKSLQNQASQRAGEVEQSTLGVRNAIGLDDQGNVVTDPTASGYGAIGKQYSDAQSSLDAANADRQSNIQSISQALQSGQISPDQAQRMGLTIGENLYDVDLSKYITPGQNLNINQTMSPEQRSYIQALSQLAGVTDTFANGSAQDKGDDYSFDSTRANNDIAASKASLGSQLNDVRNLWINAVGQDAGKGYADKSWGVDQMYKFYKDLLAKNAAGQTYIPNPSALIAGVNQYEALMNKYQPSRYLKLGDPSMLSPSRAPLIRPQS